LAVPKWLPRRLRAATPPRRAALSLSLFLSVGNEVPSAPGFLQDPVALNQLVKATDQPLGVFAVAFGDLKQSK
jgi:hypothetical protein